VVGVTHLGPRITLLVDGRLRPDAEQRALAHAADCRCCRDTLGAHRAVREALRSAPDPEPSVELVAGLLAMGGPSGPLHPRPGYLPGTPRPPALPAPGRPGGRPQVLRRRQRATVAAGAFSLVSLASLGVLGLVVLGGADGPAVEDTARMGVPDRQTPLSQPASAVHFRVPAAWPSVATTAP
jgi:hypothetical protein